MGGAQYWTGVYESRATGKAQTGRFLKIPPVLFGRILFHHAKAAVSKGDVFYLILSTQYLHFGWLVLVAAISN